MTNLEALKALCTSIANTFYPDESVLELALMNEGIDASWKASPKDPNLLRCAIPLILGYVESSKSEGGVSTSVRGEAIIGSLKRWCKEYGLDASEILDDGQLVVSNGSNLW